MEENGWAFDLLHSSDGALSLETGNLNFRDTSEEEIKWHGIATIVLPFQRFRLSSFKEKRSELPTTLSGGSEHLKQIIEKASDFSIVTRVHNRSKLCVACLKSFKEIVLPKSECKLLVYS